VPWSAWTLGQVPQVGAGAVGGRLLAVEVAPVEVVAGGRVGYWAWVGHAQLGHRLAQARCAVGEVALDTGRALVVGGVLDVDLVAHLSSFRSGLCCEAPEVVSPGLGAPRWPRRVPVRQGGAWPAAAPAVLSCGGSAGDMEAAELLQEIDPDGEVMADR
jgi:hypothetical protein